jgi:hypothetical protein
VSAVLGTIKAKYYIIMFCISYILILGNIREIGIGAAKPSNPII